MRCGQTYSKWSFMVMMLLSLFASRVAIAAVDVTPEGKMVTAEALGIRHAGVDALVFTDATNVSLTYSSSNSGTISWYRYTLGDDDKVLLRQADGTSLTVSELPPDRGYIVEFSDGGGNLLESKSVWVVDGLNHAFTPLNIDTADLYKECETVDFETKINYDGKMTYQTTDGRTVEIVRRYGVHYHTLGWDGTQYNDSIVSDSSEVRFVPADGNVTHHWNGIAPYCHTYLTLGGDQIREALGVMDTLRSDTLYVAKALTCHLKGEITERDGLNEVDRQLSGKGEEGSSSAQFGGSAPLETYFKSNANTPVAQFFKWTIIDQETPEDSSNVYHDENLRYTFNRTGVYKVILRVNRQQKEGEGVYTNCEASDSMTVIVSESMLQVPGAFSPNGDGINDEFRVAFKSLKEFHCAIYNRWGHKLYEWSDPSKGWDGRIGGRDAAIGPYYYVIKAKGTDRDSSGKEVEYSERGAVNLFR